jgi:hypothetical protein
MIWAALLIGVTVFLAIRTARRPSDARASGGPRHWLVLPDEPRTKPLALPALPAVVVSYPAWSASDQSWRADKPFQAWFRSPAPHAVAAAMGAVSLDLTALALGVPEIAPTHLPLHDRHGDHDLSDAVWSASDTMPALFGTSHADPGGFGVGLAAWDPSDFIVPSWERSPEASHDWWA